MASFSLGRASAVLASGTLVSRVLGFLLTVVTANTIGLGAAADAFTAANQLPNTIYAIIAGGTLNAVLVPQIVRAGLHADGGRTYINRLVTLALTILAMTTILAVIAAPLLVRLVAGQLDPEIMRLAIAFAYWCLPQIFFYGLYTILGEVLNARGSFGPFTWAPAVNNVVAITGILVFASLFGTDDDGSRPLSMWSEDRITLLGGSATLGVALQALILIFFWKRVGLKFSLDFRIRGVGLGTAGRMAGWTFATLLVTTVAGFVETNVASSAAGSGASIAVLKYAWLIFMLPHSVIAVSIATAYFTRMSEFAAKQDVAGMKRVLSQSFRIIGMILIFAAVALLAVAFPFARVFANDSETVIAMGFVIGAYVIALPAFSLLSIVQRAFYALGDARTPFFYTVVQAVIVSAGCILAFVLPTEYIAAQIALATSFSILVQALIASFLLRKRLGGTGGAGVIGSFLLYLLAAVPAVIVGGVLSLLALVPQFGLSVLGSKIASIVAMIVIGGIMAVIYFGVLWFFRNPDLRTFAGPIVARLRRR